MEGIGLIKTFKVGSVVDKSLKHIFATVYEIKLIKHHLEASCDLIYEYKRHLASKSALTSYI